MVEKQNPESKDAGIVHDSFQKHVLGTIYVQALGMYNSNFN